MTDRRSDDEEAEEFRRWVRWPLAVAGAAALFYASWWMHVEWVKYAVQQ